MNQPYQKRRQSLVAIGFAAATLCSAALAETVVGPDSRSGLSLTVYNQNTALITDNRKVELISGDNRLAFADVAAKIRPETVRLGGDGFTVLEQNFEYDLLTPAKMLEKFIGQDIGLVRSHPTNGNEQRENATLLSVANGVPVFKIGNRIETGGANSPWRYVFDKVPANLRAKPTLTVDLASDGPRSTELELAYLSSGLSWKTDYVATVNKADDSMDIIGWVTLTNNSGASYENADLRLVAGELNHVRPQVQYKNRRFQAEAMSADMAGASAPESLSDYYLYRFPRKTTIRDRQTKQLQLISANNVPLAKRYRVDSQQSPWRGTNTGQKTQANVVLQFRNDKPSLGIPLPEGVMRFYKGDSEGAMQLLGEDRINHTPKNEELELKLGQAFDITAERKQMENSRGFNSKSRITAWDIELRNAKNEAVEVEVLERVYGDVTVLDESQKHERVSASILRWIVQIPANGKAALSYRVQQK